MEETLLAARRGLQQFEGPAGEAAPVHPHLFRHARVRQIVRQTKSLPLAQRQAGWARLQPAYLSIGEEEGRAMMRLITD